MSFTIEIQNDFIIINNKVTLSIDCSGNLNFSKITNKSMNDEINTIQCNNIVEISKILECFVKYIKYETMYCCNMKWLMPIHIIFQKNNIELEIINNDYLEDIALNNIRNINIFDNIIYKINDVEEKIYNNINNVIDSEPIVINCGLFR